jgi:hypothetical protein
MQVKALAVMALYLGPVPRLRQAQVQRGYLKGTLDDMSNAGDVTLFARVEGIVGVIKSFFYLYSWNSSPL